MNEETAKFVRRVRRKLGLSQTNFGSILGVGRNAVMSWESGITKPTKEHLRWMRELVKAEEPLEKEILKEAFIVGGGILALYLILKGIFKNK